LAEAEADRLVRDAFPVRMSGEAVGREQVEALWEQALERASDTSARSRPSSSLRQSSSSSILASISSDGDLPSDPLTGPVLVEGDVRRLSALAVRDGQIAELGDVARRKS
jgi:hypothetical protein